MRIGHTNSYNSVKRNELNKQGTVWGIYPHTEKHSDATL